MKMSYYFKIFLRRVNPKNSPVTSLFLALNLGTYGAAKFFSDEQNVEKLIYYDPWDRYKYMFGESVDKTDYEKKLDWLKNVVKIGLTVNYPRQEFELLTNLGLLWMFARPMELLLGSRVITYNFLASLFFTGLCLIPSSANYIRNDMKMNPYIFAFSFSSAVLFNFTGATKCYRFLSILSWIPLIYYIFSYQINDYENRPIFLSALLMTLYIKYKFRVY